MTAQGRCPQCGRRKPVPVPVPVLVLVLVLVLGLVQLVG